MGGSVPEPPVISVVSYQWLCGQGESDVITLGIPGTVFSHRQLPKVQPVEVSGYDTSLSLCFHGEYIA